MNDQPSRGADSEPNEEDKLEGKLSLRVYESIVRRSAACAKADGRRSVNNWANQFFLRYLPQEEQRLSLKPEDPPPTIEPTSPPPKTEPPTKRRSKP